MSEETQKTRIVLADDHPVVLSGLRALLAAERDLEVVQVAKDGEAALAAVRAHQPDLAVLDVSMPLATGLEVLEAARRDNIQTKFVLLTASATDEQIIAAVDLGAAGIMLKDAAGDELVQCLRAVVAGGRWLPQPWLEDAMRRHKQRTEEVAQFDGVLTPRERELVQLVAEGLPNKVIARRLGLSDGTVKIHLHNVYQKLGVNNRTALAALTLARRHSTSS